MNSRSFIRLQGGVKSGSGAALWFWTFACNDLLVPRWFKTNGDPITE